MKSISKQTLLVTLTGLSLVIIWPPMAEAFLEGFATSIGQMNAQMAKFIEGLHDSVDVWATKVIDNANKEECFYICPKGGDPQPKKNIVFKPSGCSTFGIDIKDEDLPSKEMRRCCEEQQKCYHRCNSSKVECDRAFQGCLHTECVAVAKDPKSVTVCDTATKLLLMGILSFGCKTFKDAQRDVCTCPNKEL